MSMNNELNPHIVTLPIGTQAASIDLPGLKVTKEMVVKRMALINQAALAQSDTNYLQVKLVNLAGDVVIAEVSTKLTGGEGPLVANAALEEAATAALLALNTPLVLQPGTYYVRVIKNGTGVPTLAVLELEMYAK